MPILSILVTAIVYLLIFSLAWWGLVYLKMPEPVDRIVRGLCILILVLLLIGLLTGHTPLLTVR